MHSSGTNSQDSSDDSHRKFNLSDHTGTRPKFKFPQNSRLCKSVNNSYVSSQSDSSNGAQNVRRTKRKNKKATRLPPLGIFWDIENCQVPKNKSASAVVQRIREFFLEKYREAEFLVVCDVKKERSQIIQELHDSQVNLIHVASTSKNAADEKLRQSLRRFAEIYPAPSSVVLITGDINFAADLSDLRYRKKIRVILVHNANAADALILCANEHYSYSTITEGLPNEKTKGPTNDSAYLLISNLPISSNAATIKNRLNFLSNNCGGRVVEVHQEEGLAFIRFCNQDFANRAQKRIQGEDVFGNKIKVTPTLRNYTGRREKGDVSQGHQFPSRGLSLEARRYSHDQDHPIRPAAGSSLDSSHSSTRRARVSPYEFLSSRSRGNSGSSEYSDDARTHSDSTMANQPVDLIISNLDYTINIKELKKMLMNMKEHAMILSLNVDVQNDGFPVARVRASSQQAAQFIISQLHHQKWGHKKMVVSYARNNSPNPEQLRAVIVSLLQEVPEHMPLFKFMELLEHRYHCKVSVSEVSKLKDICQITENQGSRVISLTQSMKVSPPPNLSQTLVPYCTIHTNTLPNSDWCEVNISPTIMTSLKTFAAKLNKLLDIHMGCIPLYTFQNCYEQEFQEALPVDDNGVLLEHMISCVSNVEIKKYAGLSKNFKIVKREVKSAEVDEEAFLKFFQPSLASNISLFCREVVELLKSKDNCQLLVSKFIPAYHQYFSRQCHVAAYGFTKLVDLLEAISHVVQVAGDGPQKIVTLTHQTQMRRFTSDLLRVLKVQPFKQISENDFPAVYEKAMSKPFNPANYGLCTFQDLLEEIPANLIVITRTDDNVIIAIPKKEQTPEQMAKTKLFAGEVVDILKHAPNFTIPFEKFVPIYHQHFARQCRVADYGFAKLTDLFEAIPDVVKIQEMPVVGRTVSLTLEQSLNVLSNQVVELLKQLPTSSVLLEELPGIYEEKYGYPMKPQVYECETVAELVGQIQDYVQMVATGAGTAIILSDIIPSSIMKIRSWALLLKPPHCKIFSTFESEYRSRYNSDISLNDIKKILDVVSLSSLKESNYVALTDLYVLGAQLYHLLYINGGSVPFKDLEKLYSQRFGEKCRLSDYNINSFDELYRQFDFLFFKRGFMKGVLALSRTLAEHQVPLPTQIFNSNHGSKKSQPSFQKPVLSVAKKGAAKKDTTPTTNTTVWTPSQIKEDSKLNLPLEWPSIQNPLVLDDHPFDLLSPAKPLIFFKRSQWEQAPDPALLPMPNKLIMRNKNDDSGINSKLENSASEDRTELGAWGLDAKRLFGNYLNLDE